MKMPKNIFVFILLAILPNMIFAQKGKAKQILDQARKEYQKAKNLYLEYQYNRRTQNEFNGKIYIKGDHYHLISNENEQYFDGQNLYTLLHEEKEIIISNQKDGFYINPTKILDIYEKGYKFKSLGLNKGISYILLIPIDPKNKTSIEVGINSRSKRIKTIKEIRDGVMQSGIVITVYKKNMKLKDSTFVFDKGKSKYKDYYTTNLAE